MKMLKFKDCFKDETIRNHVKNLTEVKKEHALTTEELHEPVMVEMEYGELILIMRFFPKMLLNMLTKATKVMMDQFENHPDEIEEKFWN